MATQKGFTLIELMVVVAVIAILAAIALPAFNEQMNRGRRSEAMNTLSNLQLRQERWRSNSATYGSLANVGLTNATPPPGYYTYSVSTPSGNCANGVAASSANSYRITATRAGAQSNDSRCVTMVLTSLCGTIEKTSTPTGEVCWK